MTNKDSRSRKQKEVKKLTIPVNIGSDHTRGSANNNAPITVVEYGDYECPYTGMAYPIVKELIKEFGNEKIRFVFRNFPLNDIHPHAQHAAEAAAAQDKFWQMHDYLFEHQKALDDGHLLEYAQKVGLEDIHKFKDDVSRHVYSPLIEESLKGGIDSGVQGTPTFFINGVRYEDSFDLRTFSETLQKYLSALAQ
ncbi:MAG: thioredoxin domain-containing protein [Nitrososphaeraceae archaeon]|nr:thioredoxin domain-containing protein [Nitrososphaeraceae archaeon]